MSAAQANSRAPLPGDATAEPATLEGDDHRGADLRGRDFTGADLSGRDLSTADLSGAVLRGACLREARLFGANLTDCELVGADLGGADLRECRAERAGFGAASLRDATLFSADLREASFNGADLSGVDASCADLRGARIVSANCTGANFDRADARECRLAESEVAEASFESCDLRKGSISRLSGFKRANWIGANLAGVDFRGAYAVRRFALDENYLFEFRARDRAHHAIYAVWKLTSDCGRSFSRWLGLIGAVTILFGLLYGAVAIDYGDHSTWLSPYYFSLVTLTTLGYGDALPTTVPAQAVVMVEVVLGYIFLGGLICILANKLARRAG